MNLGIILTVLGGGAALLTYALIERRINQRACPHCSFRVSVDALAEQCPRCGAGSSDDWTAALRSNADPIPPAFSIPSSEDEPAPDTTAEPGRPSDRCLAAAPAHRVTRPGLKRPGIYRLSWLVLLGPPLALAIVDASMTIVNWSRPNTEKAIRLVQSSSSRIENFTVQQYLYSTLYDRKEKGADVTIDGWRAEQQPGSGTLLTVEFDFTDEHRPHAAVWEVDLPANKVTPTNEDARNLSWE
jgi:hypothetical protein